jgi:hypothetical protein
MQSNLARLLALLVVFSVVGLSDARAQEPANAVQAAEIDELEPGVSAEVLTEAALDEREDIDPSVSTTAKAAEIEATEPGVPSAVLAHDVRRREVSNGVMDEIDLGRTEITGNQELPTVLYIVPWKKSDPGDLMGRPVNTLLDEVLAPIDRSEFIRQVDYYEDLYGEEEGQD